MPPVVNKRKREGIQLCKVYEPGKKLKFSDVILEPKLDGYRCIARVENKTARLLTSTGLPHNNVDHIIDQLEAAAAEYPHYCDNIVLDGELLHDDLPFDVAGGILRKSTEKDERSKGFTFWVWDCLPITEFDAKTCTHSLLARKGRMDIALQNIAIAYNATTHPRNYVLPVSYSYGTLETIEPRAQAMVQGGYEGIIIKDMNSLYEYRKSGVWLKWKPRLTTEGWKEMHEGDLAIVGAVEGRGKQKGMLGALVTRGYLQEDGNISPEPNGSTKEINTEVGTGFTDAERKALWERFHNGTLLGVIIEVKYTELSKDGALRSPSFSRLREDKERLDPEPEFDLLGGEPITV